MNRIPLFPLLVLLSSILPTQASGSFFDRTTLNVEGKVIRVVVEDLNDDGRLDVLAIYTTGHHPDPQRWLAVFWQKEDRIFDPGPDQAWRMDPQAAVLDVGDVSPEPGQEILYLAGDGVYFYGHNGGAFVPESRRLFEANTLFLLAEEADLPVWDFAQEICPDDGDEVLVPWFGEMSLWCQGVDRTYRSKQTFTVETTVRVYAETPGENYTYSLRADYRVPRIETKNFDNDSRTDIIASWEDNLDVFLQGVDGTFPPTPDHQLRMSLRTEEELESDEVDVLLSAHDLNGDGQADIVANKMKGGLTNATTQTSLFLCQIGGDFKETPDQLMTAEDAVSEPYLIDVNGDDRLDLIQPEVKMGIKSVVSMLLMKKVNINFMVYLNRGDGRFAQEPDFSTKVGFKIDFTRRGGRASPLIEFEGDYNGDGRKDLAVGTKEEELSIFFGDKHKVFTKNPQVQEAVKTSSNVVAKDFDGDGKSEMLIFYPDDTKLSGRITLLWPK